MGQTHCQAAQGEQMRRRDQRESINMQCTTQRLCEKVSRLVHLKLLLKQVLDTLHTASQVLFLSKSYITIDIKGLLQRFTTMDSNGLSEPHH